MKIFNRIFSVLLLPLLFIGSINYLIDPDYTLRHNYIPEVASALADGRIISGPVNANDRLLKKVWIGQLKFQPDLLILGSSRTMGLTQEPFGDKQILNASVTNGTLQDMYAFVDIIENKLGAIPSEVVICCDQWLLGHAFEEIRWLINRNHFVNLLQKTDKIPRGKFSQKWALQKEWIKELFSIRYLIRSIRFFGKAEAFVVQDKPLTGSTMMMPDGSRQLPLHMTNPKPEEVEKLAVTYFNTSKDERFAQLDPLQCSLLENLIIYLQKQNCTVTLFIPPYHPVTWQLMHQSQHHTGIFNAERYLQKLAHTYSLNTIGNTNPANLKFNDSHFYDGVHLKPEALAHLTRSFYTDINPTSNKLSITNNKKHNDKAK